jgi:hypothetical protein
MTWRNFWFTFCAVQLVGLGMSAFGVFIHFYAVIGGMLLLFPGLFIASYMGIPQNQPWSVLLGAAIVLIVNATFWITFIRPKPRIV